MIYDYNSTRMTTFHEQMKNAREADDGRTIRDYPSWTLEDYRDFMFCVEKGYLLQDWSSGNLFIINQEWEGDDIYAEEFGEEEEDEEVIKFYEVARAEYPDIEYFDTLEKAKAYCDDMRDLGFDYGLIMACDKDKKHIGYYGDYEEEDEDEDECLGCGVEVDRDNCYIDEWNNKNYNYCYECYESDEEEEKMVIELNEKMVLLIEKKPPRKRKFNVVNKSR